METTKYRIVSQGNGLCVTVTRKSDGWDFFLQGDDAANFLNECDGRELRSRPESDPNYGHTIDAYIEEYAELFTNPAPISGKL